MIAPNRVPQVGTFLVNPVFPLERLAEQLNVDRQVGGAAVSIAGTAGTGLARATEIRQGGIGGISIGDIANGARKVFLKECSLMVRAVAWSPDGQHVAAATDRGTVVIWDVASGKTDGDLIMDESRRHAASLAPVRLLKY